jgi:hypothetical protein
VFWNGKDMKGTEKFKGMAMVLIAIVLFSVYAYLLFATDLGILILKLTIAVIVGVICFVVGWIGITLAINGKEQEEGA